MKKYVKKWIRNKDKEDREIYINFSKCLKVLLRYRWVILQDNFKRKNQLLPQPKRNTNGNYLLKNQRTSNLNKFYST